MGFLDSITNIFTGDPLKEAADKSRQFFDQTRDQGNTNITNALQDSMGFVNRGTQGGRDALRFGYDAGTGSINSGADQALGYLGAGTGGALSALGGAGAAYDPLAALGNKYGGATSLALNALGVNGAPGTDAARSAFQASPGYQFNLDQGLEAINRRRAAGGMLNSGNADRDAQTFGAGLASQEYGNWMNQLLGFTNPEMNATAGAAAGRSGALTNTANLLSGSGRDMAGVASGRGAMLADLAKSYGGNLSGLDVNEGNTLAGLTTGAARDRNSLAMGLAQPYANTYKDEANAEMMGSKNLWGLGMQLGGLAMGGLGGMGGLGSSLFSGASGLANMAGGAGAMAGSSNGILNFGMPSGGFGSWR